MGLFKKIKEGLKKTRDAIVGQIDTMLKSFTKIDEELFEELLELLIMGDVGVTTSEHICDELRKRVKKEGITDPAMIHDLLADVIADMLGNSNELMINTKPSIILVIGVNGVGKTTTIGKIAANLVRSGKKVTLAAADTFRAAAIDQLEIWAERSGADIIKQQEGSDPAAVVFDAISSAKAKGSDVIIADTAGRLHNKKHLMDELAKINRVIDRELPDADKEVCPALAHALFLQQAPGFQTRYLLFALGSILAMYALFHRSRQYQERARWLPYRPFATLSEILAHSQCQPYQMWS